MSFLLPLREGGRRGGSDEGCLALRLPSGLLDAWLSLVTGRRRHPSSDLLPGRLLPHGEKSAPLPAKLGVEKPTARTQARAWRVEIETCLEVPENFGHDFGYLQSLSK